MSAAIQPQFITIDGLSIRFAESDPRSEDALLLSPWPESLFAFEPTWTCLAERAHLVAMDLPGFGQSQGRRELMSPEAMGAFIVRAADVFGLRQPHVIGPDVGTAAGLFAAASAPGRLRSLVVGSGGSAFPLQLTGVLKEWVEAPDLEPYRRIDGRQVVRAAMASLERHRLAPDAWDDYLASYQGERFAESMRYVRTYPTALRQLRDLLPNIRTPVLILSGNRDRVVSRANADYLHRLLPRSKAIFLDAGHFLWEDAAEDYAERVVLWWAGEYQPIASGNALSSRLAPRSFERHQGIADTIV
jgi:pimeloyl-ACP methyl ester carboxylesterase